MQTSEKIETTGGARFGKISDLNPTHGLLLDFCELAIKKTLRRIISVPDSSAAYAKRQ